MKGNKRIIHITPAMLMALLLISFNASARFDSPFPSTVEGLDIPNSHLIAEGPGRVLRGMAPDTAERVNSLINYGVTDVLIFKNEIKNEVSKEISDLENAGINRENIQFIPFRWKDIGSFQEACEQTIDGLEILIDVLSSENRTVYFHCTVGEDRTGVLAGLFRMLNDGWDEEKAFQEEMCENGYEAGNPQKPYAKVVKEIEEELTPFYLKMASLIKSGMISAQSLDKNICSSEPEISDSRIFKCAASSKFVNNK